MRIFTVILVLLLSQICMAATIHVPGDYTTIQEGINNASSGDTVLVADDTYTGDVNLGSLQIYLISENGAANTIIEGRISVGSSVYSEVNGFTARSILAEYGSTAYFKYCTIDALNNSGYGPACRIRGADIQFENCIFQNNYSSDSDGGAFFVTGRVLFDDCYFTNNYARLRGSCIFGHTGAKIFIYNTDFIDNHPPEVGATYLHCISCDSIVMENCLGVGDIQFLSNEKIGIWDFSGYASIKNCTFDGTKTPGWVPYLMSFIRGSSNPTINIENCIFSHFSSFLNADEYGDEYINIDNCVLYDFDSLFSWSEPFAFSYYNTDPLYCDTTSDDYTISSTSFCDPANNPSGELIGALPSGCKLDAICGDANSDDNVNVSDAVVIINFVFNSGSYMPAPLMASDVNCDDRVNVSDAVYLISYVFSGGNVPCNGCQFE